jgi:hypothetical protein
MGKINWGRVILGGLIAGLVVNVFEGAAGAVLQEEYKAAMAALGKTMEMTPGMMVFYLAFGFVYGIFAVWLYAAVRPRYGPGPRTAACAGFAVWFIGYLLPTVGYVCLGLFPTRLMTIAAVVGLVETILGTVLGAWLYKEA